MRILVLIALAAGMVSGFIAGTICTAKKEPAAEEQGTMGFAFATVVTIKPISKGEPFTEDNLWVKRPGSGEILAEEYEGILGKCATTDLAQDVQLKFSDIQS